MRRAWTWWLAWGLVGVVVALTFATVLVDASTSDPPGTSQSVVGNASVILAFWTFAVVGALVASRQPRNAVGWLFLTAAVSAMAGAFAEKYAYRALVVHPGEPAGIAVGWIYGWAWKLATGAIVLVPLLFPDGRLPSRRWRPLLWASVALLVLTIVATAVYPGPIDSTWPGTHEKPLTIGGLKGFLHAAENPAGLVFVLLLAGLVASVVVRFRRSRGDERQQLKWMLAAVAVLVAWILIDQVLGTRTPAAVHDLLFAFASPWFPSRPGSRCSSTACTTSTS